MSIRTRRRLRFQQLLFSSAITSDDRLFRESKPTLECRSQELDVDLLILSNFYQVLVEGVGEASIEEILTRKVGETLTVEGILEMLESQRKIEDFSVAKALRSLGQWMGSSTACEQGSNTEGLHGRNGECAKMNV
jgi:hypothetical protein